MGVFHRCDTPLCVNPDHLFIGTWSDNVEDKVVKNRQCLGAKVWSARITEEQALEIKRRMRKIPRGGRKAAYRRIAEEFGLSPNYIHHIAMGRKWKHLNEN